MKTDLPEMSFREWAVKAPTAVISLIICIYALLGAFSALMPAMFAADAAGDYRLMLAIVLGQFAAITGSVTISKWFNNQVVSFFAKRLNF